MTRVLAALVVALAAGCASTPPTGPVERPEIYPDRTSALAAWRTFAWAWKTGDIDVLLLVTGGWIRANLDKELAANPREKVAEYYRKDAEDLRVAEAEWIHRGEALAYLRVVLVTPRIPRTEVDFAITGRGLDDWVITGRKPVR